MNKLTPATSNDLSTRAEDARALMAATADVAGEKVGDSRQGLAAALESGKKKYGGVRDNAVVGAKVVDQTVCENPDYAMGVAQGVGVLIGYLGSRRCSRNGD